MKGFSSRNLKYMWAFAKAYPDEQIVQQAAAQIPWFHNCILLDKVKEPTERLWYIQQTIEYGCTDQGANAPDLLTLLDLAYKET